MKNPGLFRLAAPLLVLALAQGTAFGQSTSGSAGDEGEGTTVNSAVPGGGTTQPPALAEPETTRDIVTDIPPELSGLTTVSKSSDGTITSTPASAALAAALAGLTAPDRTGAAADVAEAKAAKVAPVKKTTVYPYRAVGQIEVTYGQNIYYCTGVLIGPSTVATAAACLWGAEDNAVWTDHVAFYPAVNGGTAPYGSTEWTGALIMQGFIDARTTATSNGPLPYGIGLVTLADPIGDKLGYFGFQTDVNKSYKANAITYGSGDTLHNMATTTCPVDVATMYRSFAYPNPCPAGGFGSPFYFDDPSSKGKVLNGMNIYSFDDGSSGEARISAVTYEWITENRK